MTPQFLKRCVRPLLRGVPIGVPENLSKLVPRKKALGAPSPAYMSALGDYEMPVQRAIADNLDEGGICYDIGANVGFFSVFASRVGAGGKVFAFEPEPGNAARLRHNIEMNGFTAS
jgi:hypothetical protein